MGLPGRWLFLCAGLAAAPLHAADAASDAWPARPAPPPPQVVSPAGTGEAQPTQPVTPETLFAAPAPPTQSVPAGERSLVGPPVTMSPDGSAYELDAPDYASASRVLEMCDRMKTLVARYCSWPSQPMARIQLQLVPPAQAAFAGPYAVKTGGAGLPITQVRWGPDTAFFDVCQAVSSATLQNVVYTNDGAAAAGQVPDWLKLGFAAMLEASLKPPMMDDLDDEGHRLPMLAMRQIMAARAPTGPDVHLLAVNAFWLLTTLNDQCPNPDVARSLFNGLAAGVDPVKLLVTAFPDKISDPRDLELWWQINYRDEIALHAPPFQTLAESRALLDQLERIQVIRGNLPQLVRLDDAWDDRSDKKVRAAIEKTLESARGTPDRANPAYKNALVSLLIALEKLHGDDQAAFAAAWKQYQTDRAAGEAIENTVDAALPVEAAK